MFTQVRAAAVSGFPGVFVGAGPAVVSTLFSPQYFAEVPPYSAGDGDRFFLASAASGRRRHASGGSSGGFVGDGGPSAGGLPPSGHRPHNIVQRTHAPEDRGPAEYLGMHFPGPILSSGLLAAGLTGALLEELLVPNFSAAEAVAGGRAFDLYAGGRLLLCELDDGAITHLQLDLPEGDAPAKRTFENFVAAVMDANGQKAVFRRNPHYEIEEEVQRMLDAGRGRHVAYGVKRFMAADLHRLFPEELIVVPGLFDEDRLDFTGRMARSGAIQWVGVDLFPVAAARFLSQYLDEAAAPKEVERSHKELMGEIEERNELIYRDKHLRRWVTGLLNLCNEEGLRLYGLDAETDYTFTAPADSPLIWGVRKMLLSRHVPPKGRGVVFAAPEYFEQDDPIGINGLWLLKEHYPQRVKHLLRQI